MNASLIFLAALAVLLSGAAASSQAAPNLVGSRLWGLPVFKGRVDLFTLTPRGAIDGLVLGDGTEVKTPPHLSRAILRAVRPGDIVTVRGLKAAALPLVEAVSIEDETSAQTVLDTGPGASPSVADNGAIVPVTTTIQRVEGRIRLVLHGARGDVNGVLFDGGIVVRLPPPDAVRLAPLLMPDHPLIVDGMMSTSPLGCVIEVSAMGASADRMELVGPAARAEDHRP